MVSLALVRAEDAPKRCRIEAATFNQDEWPERNEGPGFLGIGAAAERREASTSGRSRPPERLILVDGDADAAMGSVIISESAHPPRGAPRGTVNCVLNSLVVAPEMRGGGRGKALAVLATRWAIEHMNAGVVTAWCLKPLLGLYVDACGFEYEPPARVGFDDDDGGDVCCRAWADRWRAPPT